MCETCGETLANPKLMNDHIKKVHNNEKATDAPLHICDHCGRSFTSKHTMDSHVRRNHGPKFLVCMLCEQWAKSCKMLQNHLQDAHGLKFEKWFAKDLYPCFECERKFECSSNLNKHLVDVHNCSLEHKCSDCNESFASSNILLSHKFDEHRYDPYEKAKTGIECKICGKWLKNERTLGIHTLQEHEKEKHTYKCQNCNYSTYEPGRLEKHDKAKHQDAKDFKCNLCDFVTNIMETLRRHVAVKHDENHGFKVCVKECDHCHKRFSNLTNLREHQFHKHNIFLPEEVLNDK